MGYTTDFRGEFRLNRELTDDDYNFLVKFSQTRRMARNVGPEYGIEGEYYVDGGGFRGQGKDLTVIDHNRPPKTQPSLWCQWIPSEDKKSIVWDQGEKFYDYVDWLQYLVNWLAPRGYILTGNVEWQGEDFSDRGLIVVTDNNIVTKEGRAFYDDI